jgi:hypothetical protein
MFLPAKNEGSKMVGMHILYNYLLKTMCWTIYLLRPFHMSMHIYGLWKCLYCETISYEHAYVWIGKCEIHIIVNN